jgi:anti-anti-sigma factor
MDMDVTELDGRATCVRLTGRLDAAGADSIDLKFTAAVVPSGRPAVIDLSGISFIASMGLRLLISAAKGLNVKGAKMALFGAPPLVKQVLEETAIDQIIDIAASEDEALARVAA